MTKWTIISWGLTVSKFKKFSTLFLTNYIWAQYNNLESLRKKRTHWTKIGVNGGTICLPVTQDVPIIPSDEFSIWRYPKLKMLLCLCLIQWTIAHEIWCLWEDHILSSQIQLPTSPCGTEGIAWNVIVSLPFSNDNTGLDKLMSWFSRG